MFSKIIENKLYIELGPTNLLVEVVDRDKNKIFNYIIENLPKMLWEISSEIKYLKMCSENNHCFKFDVTKKMYFSSKVFLPSFITPMVCVAGAVSEQLLENILSKFNPDKLLINNGGDIALFLNKKQSLKLLIANKNEIVLTLDGNKTRFGIATSGWRGRSFSLGIADSVTVIGNNACIADAAATMIANDINIVNHPNIERKKALEIDDHSDLKETFVTTFVGKLSEKEIEESLERGKKTAEKYINDKIILSAILNLKENYLFLGKKFPLTSKKIIL